MAARPWMPFYFADYLADTAHLSTVEHGAYFLLIAHYWAHGGLPEDEAVIARITRMTARQWSQSRDVLRSLFGDNWCHKRIDREIAKAIEKSEVNSANAQRRHAIRTANAQRSDTQPQPQPQLQSENTERKKDILSETSVSDAPKRKRISYPEEFENFWRAYPTDPLQSKKEAFDAWKRLAAEDRTLALKSLPAFRRYCEANPDYRPIHACRYLKQRRFDGFTSNTGAGPPPNLTPEERAKWVRAQMDAENEKNQAANSGVGKVLVGSQAIRAA